MIINLIRGRAIRARLLRNCRVIFSPLNLRLFRSNFRELSNALRLFSNGALTTANLCLYGPLDSLISLFVRGPFLALPTSKSALGLTISRSSNVVVAHHGAYTRLLSIVNLGILFNNSWSVNKEVRARGLQHPLLYRVI